jgi:predicted phage-related endonuclease
MASSIVEDLRTRAKIRREIRERNQVLPKELRDKIADLCDRAADEIDDLYMRLHVCADDRKRIKADYDKLFKSVHPDQPLKEWRMLSDD